jgi:hypothetical protein
MQPDGFQPGMPAPYTAAAQAPVHPTSEAPRSVHQAMHSNVGRPPRSFVAFGVGGRCCFVKAPRAGHATFSQGQPATSFITDVSSLPKVIEQSKDGMSPVPTPPVHNKRGSKSSSFRSKEKEKESQATSAIFRDWPGPMATSTPAAKAIAAAVDARAKVCESEGESAHALIWRLLGVMAKNKGATIDGAVKGAQPQNDILKLLSADLENMGSTTTAAVEEVTHRVNTWVAHDAPTPSVRLIEDLLVSGKRAEALEAAKSARVRQFSNSLISCMPCLQWLRLDSTAFTMPCMHSD